jgi:signal peptidase I
MSFIELVIGTIIYSSFYLYYNHFSIIIGFLLLILFFYVFYRLNTNKINIIPGIINPIIRKSPDHKQSLKEQKKQYYKLSRRPNILPVLVPLLITGFTAYIILSKIIFFAIITSDSMSPALETKDLVLMQNLKVDPQQGDIIMFETKEATMPVIHRIDSISGENIRTKGDAAELVDNWIIRKDQIQGEALIFQGKPILVKSIGEYLLFDPNNVRITKYGSEIYQMSKIIKNIKNLGLTIFIICILLYIFMNFRSTGKSY